jgi:hypothetical protein
MQLHFIFAPLVSEKPFFSNEMTPILDFLEQTLIQIAD